MILLLIVISQSKMWISWNLLWTLFEKINNTHPLLHYFQYGPDTSEFTYNPAEPDRLQQNAAPPTEDRSHRSIMWSLFVENFEFTDEQVMSATDSTCCLVKVAQGFFLVCGLMESFSRLVFSRVIMLKWFLSGENCNLWAQCLPFIPSSALRWWIHLAWFYEWKMLGMIYHKWKVSRWTL